MVEDWPALPYADWEPTKQTLHRYTQIVGKVRMALTPPLNHWWHVTLLPASRGLTTGPMRESADPAATLLAFYESAYSAGARSAGWDLGPLTRHKTVIAHTETRAG